jgi:hypothetical protein
MRTLIPTLLSGFLLCTVPTCTSADTACDTLLPQMAAAMQGLRTRVHEGQP